MTEIILENVEELKKNFSFKIKADTVENIEILQLFGNQLKKINGEHELIVNIEDLFQTCNSSKVHLERYKKLHNHARNFLIKINESAGYPDLDNIPEELI